jgi:hypothetical protein
MHTNKGGYVLIGGFKLFVFRWKLYHSNDCFWHSKTKTIVSFQCVCKGVIMWIWIIMKLCMKKFIGTQRRSKKSIGLMQFFFPLLEKRSMVGSFGYG